MLFSHRSTLQTSVQMLGCHVHPECAWPGFLTRSSQTDAHGFCSPPNQNMMPNCISWLFRSCRLGTIHVLSYSGSQRPAQPGKLPAVPLKAWSLWKDDIFVACTPMTVNWCTDLYSDEPYNPTVKSAQMPFMARQSYLDTHLLEPLYRETTAELVTVDDPFLPGGQTTRCWVLGRYLLRKVGQTEAELARLAKWLQFKEIEVVSLPWISLETAATQKISSSPGSAIRPWCLSVDKVHRITCLCTHKSPRVQLAVTSAGLSEPCVCARSQEGSVRQTHICHFLGRPIGSIQSTFWSRSMPKDCKKMWVSMPVQLHFFTRMECPDRGRGWQSRQENPQPI